MKKWLAGFYACLSICATAVAGPLIGQTLAESGGVGIVTPSSAVVGPGVEFFEPLFSPDGVFTIDFSDSGLLTVTWAAQVLSLTAFSPDVQTYTDVNFTIPRFIGFDLLNTSRVTGITQSDLSFTADRLTISLGSGTFWLGGGFFTAQILFEQIPEPATLVLLGIGFAGVTFSRRRMR